MRKKIIIVTICIILMGVLAVSAYVLSNKKTPKEEPKQVEIIDSINGYDYHLKDRDTLIYKENFLNLKEILESESVDDEEYAKAIAKLFIIDLYTLNNKINKYDVGSIDFVLPSIVDNYSLNVKDTLYKYLEDNSDDKRTQPLPEVASIEVIDFSESKYKIDKDTEEISYEATLNWTYKKDLGYDSSGKIILIKQNQLIYVVEKSDITKK